MTFLSLSLEFKVELPIIPKVVSPDGYITAKRYLKCNNESCDVKGTKQVTLFITKLNNSSGRPQIGDEVLLSTQKSGKRGEWILCDLGRCHSSLACSLSTYNASSGEVNFAFNRKGCKDHVLKVSTKTKEHDKLVDNNTRIVLEYSNPRTTQEWIGCDSNYNCKRTQCQRIRDTLLRHTSSTTCKSQMDEFETIFV